MNDYILSCCSTADLSKEHFDSRTIKYVCFHFFLDGVQYPDDLGESVPFDEFYKKMAEGSDTKTSQVNVEEFIEYFTPFLKEGKDIIHVSLSSGLSGAYNSACVAREQLLELFPDRKIIIVDSLAASSGYGLFMDTLADLRDSGMAIDELAAWANENKLYLHHWFFSTDLTFYVKGGRISKASGWFGTMLKICPLLDMDAEGHLVPRFKVRGKAKVITEMFSKMKVFAKGREKYSGKCFISNSDCIDDAREVAGLIEAYFKGMNGKVLINSVGTVIGSHTGPGTVALFFWSDTKRFF